MAMQRQPVLYLFSGIDVLTAHALFPNSAVVMAADLPIGRPWCLASPRCAAAAHAAVVDYFTHLMKYEFAWTSTTHMLSIIQRGYVVGVAPLLCVCAALMGHRVTSMRFVHESSTTSKNASARNAATTPPTSLHIETAGGGPRISYHAFHLATEEGSSEDGHHHYGWKARPRLNHSQASRELARLSDLVQERAPQPPHFTLLLKAAPHFITRDPLVASWLLRTATATVHDETGLRPTAYADAAAITGRGGRAHAWSCRRFGTFVDWTFRERLWYPAEETRELREAHRDAPPLPFQFGYAAGATGGRHVGNGVLAACVRGGGR